MKQSLYNIEAEYLQLSEQLIENGGEATPELEQALAMNKENLETKSTNYGFVIRKLEGECAIIDAEMERLEKIKSSREKAVKRLKNNIVQAMEIFQVETIKTPILNLSIRTSEAVEIEDSALIHQQYKKTKTVTETSIDKVAIKEAIKSGKIVPGAILRTNKNLQIK